MFTELGVVGKLTKTVLDILGITFYSNRRKAEAYITEVLEHVSKVILGENEKEIEYSHAIVKKIHENVSMDVGNIVSGNNLEKIKQALDAARIYFWAAKMAGKPDSRVLDIIEARRYRIESRSVRHNSLEYVIRKIMLLDEKTPKLVQREVEMIQENCIADIAELKEMEISVVKSALRKR